MTMAYNPWAYRQAPRARTNLIDCFSLVFSVCYFVVVLVLFFSCQDPFFPNPVCPAEPGSRNATFAMTAAASNGTDPTTDGRLIVPVWWLTGLCAVLVFTLTLSACLVILGLASDLFYSRSKPVVGEEPSTAASRSSYQRL